MNQLARQIAARLTAAATAATLLAAASCEQKDPTPAPAPAPAVTYPSLAAPFTYDVQTPPTRWQLTNVTGKIKLREGQEFQLYFRIDPAHPGESELVKSYKATGDKEGWVMTPVAADGGKGYRADYTTATGQRHLLWFLAKGMITVTLSVQLGAQGDPAASAAADSLMASLKFSDTATEGMTWPMPTASIPFSYDMPRSLVGQKQSASLLDYAYSLWWANQSVQVVTSLGEDPETVRKFYEDKRAAFTKAGVTIRKFSDLPSHEDEGLLRLSKAVDEGFAIKINREGKPLIGAIVFYRKNFYTMISVQAVPSQELDSLYAMVAPFHIGGTITFPS
jgi:hypothetical protein